MAKEDLFLSEQDKQKLDGVVKKMISNKESDEDIKFVIDHFKSKYGLKKKEPTQSDLAAGESLSPSTEVKPPKVEAADETPVKPVSILDRYKVGEGLDRDRKIAEQDVLSRKPIPAKVEKTTIVSKDPIFGLPVYKEKTTKVITDDRERPQLSPKVESAIKAQPITKSSKTKYLWGEVQKDIDASNSITTNAHFNKLSDAFANNYLDEAQLQEYNFVKNLRNADEQVNSLQIELQKNPNNPVIQLSLSKAIAAKTQQETQYIKFKEDKYKQIDAEIKDLEEKVNLNPVTSSFWDVFRRDDFINKIKELKAQKENFFLDENALIQKKYSENKSALSEFEIPGNTPKEKLQNYYLTLSKERSLIIDKLKQSYGEDVLTNIGGTIQAQLASYLGIDNNADKLLAIDEKMKSLAPAVLINRNPVKDVNQGFFESTLKNATQTLIPSTQYVISNPSELASYVKESLALASLPEDVLSKATGKIVSEKAKGPESYNKEWWGNIVGTSVGMIPYFAVGTGLVKSASVAMDFTKIANYLAGAKYGKYLVAEPVMTGLGYKAAGYLMPSNSLVKDEATFLSGFFGGLGVTGVNKLMNTNYIAKMFNKLFGDKAESMAIMVAESGKRISSGVGETFEETGNNIGPMIDAWIATGDFQKLKSDFNENFGSMDKNLELFVASFTMGAIMGHGNVYGKTVDARSKDYYNNLSAEDKKKADSFVERLTQERYNAMVAAKKDEIKKSGAKAEPVTPKDLTDRQDAIDVLTNQESTPEEKKAALSVLADVDIKIENDKITKAAEAELKAGNTSTEVKPEDAVMEPIPSAEGTVITSEGTVEPAATEAKPLEEGDQVQLEPQMKGGMPRVMEFKNGTWQQKVGNEYTTVSKEVQQEAQNLYDSQNEQRVSGEVRVGQEPVKTEPIEGGRQEAPSPSGNVQALEEVDETKAGAIELKTMEIANQNVTKFLEDSGIEVNIMNTQEEFDAAQKDEGLAAERGTEGMFISKSGKIYINKSNLGKGWAKTILYHEATHPVINIIRNTNIEKYNSMVSGVKELAKTNKDVNDALEWAKKQYAGKPEGTIEDEGIVEVIARISSGAIKFGQIEPTLREKIVDFINKIAKAIGLPPITPKTDTETFKKTARQVADAMRRGKSISKVVGKENVKKYQFDTISNLGGQLSITRFGKTGIKKVPVLDIEEYKRRIENGTLKVSSPQEALGDNTFMLTFPDDLFVGDVFVGDVKVADFGGGVIYVVVDGESGRMWASVNERTAKAFADNVNKSLEINKGTAMVVLVKGTDTKHASSMSAKVGFMKALLRYAEKNESMADGLLTAIKEIYSIGNVTKPETAINRFNNYLEGGRGEDGQTMKEAKSAYDGLRASLVKYANPLITKMALEMGYGDGYFNATKLKGKNPSYEASNATVDKMFADILQEDFLKGVPDGQAYAVIKATSKVVIKHDLSHPSYPWVIQTEDGSPVTLELFDKTFMTYGENEAITGRYDKPTQVPSGRWGVVSYTVPKFKLNPNKKLSGPGTTDLLGVLNKYKTISEAETKAKSQKSVGQREDLQKSEKQITFAQDETRRTKEATPSEVSFAERIGRPVGYDALRVGQPGVEERGFTKTDLNKSFKIGGRDVKVKSEFAVQPSVKEGIKANIPNAYIDKALLEITGDPDSYHKFISTVKANHPQGAAVYVYPKQDYANMRLFITPDGEAGVAIKPNGDFVSAFNRHIDGEGRKPNRLAQLMILGIKAGAKKADAFDTVLPNYYSKFGFRVVAKVPFSWDAAPEAFEDEYGNKHKGWEKEDFIDFNQGEPDVTFLVYDGGDRATIQNRVGDFDKYSLYKDNLPESTYDEAVEIQNKALKGEAQKSVGGRNLAPNGKPSNLNEVQYKQVRTPEFKKWFGDWENDPENASKIVDENGEPKVMYTGTSKDKDFDKFNVPKNGAWFSGDPAVASMYAETNDSQKANYDRYLGAYTDVNTRPRVIPVFLNVRRPQDFKEVTTQEQRDKMNYSASYKKLQALYFQNIYFDKPIGERTDGLYMDNKSTVIILEDPNQIKSATGNSGKFSPTDNRIQMSTGGREVMNVGGVQQRVKDLPEGLSIVEGFYSPIEKRIIEFKQPKASATKWKEIVGAKSDEAVFSGMTEWLNTFKPDQQISKEEVQDFIKNNRVEIKQVIKADNWREFYDQRVAAMNKEYDYFKTKGIGRFDIQRTIPDAIFDKLNDADQDRLINLKAEQDFLGDVYFDYGNARQVLTGAKESEMPKYKKYVERGDFDDYKEILVTAPVGTKAQMANANIERRLNEIDDELTTVRTYKKVGDSGTVSDFELVVTDQEKFDKLVAERKSLLEEDKKVYKQIQDAKDAEYRSSHYNEKNIVVHTRTDVRNDQNGDKLFFIEEVQSDWGQQGKKEGFDAIKKYNAAKTFYYSIYKERLMGYISKDQAIEKSNQLTKETGFTQAELVDEMNKRGDFTARPINISPAPYVTNTNAWVKLGLKIALQQAVQADAAKIAWTTGEQQNKRYDLSKQVDAITYEKNDDGTYNVDGLKNNRSISYQENMTVKQMESALGKDVAQRIVDNEGDTYLDGKYMGGIKVLTGDQLSVGGKGMTGFYGSLETPGIMGNAIKALVKELTGKEPTIEASALGYTDDYEDEVISNKEEYDAALKRAGVFLYKGEVLSKSEAFDYLERGMKIGATFPKVDLQPSIEITPELKAAVERGMAQFSKGERGVKPTFEEATDLFYKIKGTEGAAKKKALADERKALMDQNPSVKYIDDNIKTILDQLEKKEMATRKGNCP